MNESINNGISIICDNRERHVIPYMEDLGKQHEIPYLVQTLNVGDFSLCYNGKIIAIIERKTWADLAASMTDGRKQNVEKLKQLRDASKCKIFYLIEGDADPKRDKKFNRCSVKGLIAHLDHLIWRDNIHIIYAKDSSSSALRLFELCINLSTIKEDLTHSIGVSNVSLLGSKFIFKSSIQAQMLACFPHVGSIIAEALTLHGWTLYKLLTQIEQSDIESLKYANGASMYYKTAEKIYLYICRIRNVKTKISARIGMKVLTCIKGVSSDTAETIIKVYPLMKLIQSVSVDDLSELQRGKQKIGEKLANDILDVLKDHSTPPVQEPDYDTDDYDYLTNEEKYLAAIYTNDTHTNDTHDKTSKYSIVSNQDKSFLSELELSTMDEFCK